MTLQRTVYRIALICLVGGVSAMFRPGPGAALAEPRGRPPSPSSQPAAAAPASDEDWQTYRDDQVGFSVEYPSSWLVTRQPGSDGTVLANFTPPAGGAGLTVIAGAGGLELGSVSDMPNTRCRPVAVGAQSGLRCLDTLSFSTTTTVAAQGWTYIFVAGRRLEPSLYEHLLDSFVLLGGSAPRAPELPAMQFEPIGPAD